MIDKNKKIIFLMTFFSFAHCMEVDSGASSSTGKRRLESREMREGKHPRVHISDHDLLKSIFENHGCGRVQISVDRETKCLELSFAMVKQGMNVFFYEINLHMPPEHIPQDIPDDCDEHRISIDQAIQILGHNIASIKTMQIAYVNHSKPSHQPVYTSFKTLYNRLDKIETADDFVKFFTELYPTLKNLPIIKERIAYIDSVQRTDSGCSL